MLPLIEKYPGDLESGRMRWPIDMGPWLAMAWSGATTPDIIHKYPEFQENDISQEQFHLNFDTYHEALLLIQ